MVTQFNSKYSSPQIERLLDAVNEMAPAAAKGYELYCYRKSIDNNSPYTRIEYLEDNKNFRPAGMNFATGKFDFGDWGNAFFMKVRPCMLNNDGTVAYNLNINNYKEKEDGTPSDVTNVNFPGNAMCGIPTIWFKRVTIGRYIYVYICNIQLDETFKAYAHTSPSGQIMKYTYLPIYNGSIQNGKLRSLSGFAPTVNTNATQEFNAAFANNPTGKNIWNIEVRADIQMLYDLCMLIGKSNNTQKTFGYGNYTGGTSAASFKVSGTMDDKGLFFGTRNNNDCVKIFGIEHFYGQRWGRVAGSIYDKGKMKVKMTYGTEDGSSVVGYNQDGTGYVEIPNSTISGTSGGYVSETYTNEYGTFIKTISGSDDTYECDGGWYNNNQINMEIHGGSSGYGLLVGAGCVVLSHAPSYSSWAVGASCSCKPDVEENIYEAAA